jgi:hypothetical protein
MLEYFLLQLGDGTFVFQVVAQEDRITNYVKAHNPFLCANGWKVAISEEPEINIDKKMIYLRGNDKDLDFKVDRHWDLKGKEARDIVKQVNAALKELVEATKAWKHKHELKIIDTIVISPRYDPWACFATLGPAVVVRYEL